MDRVLITVIIFLSLVEAVMIGVLFYICIQLLRNKMGFGGLMGMVFVIAGICMTAFPLSKAVEARYGDSQPDERAPYLVPCDRCATSASQPANPGFQL